MPSTVVCSSGSRGLSSEYTDAGLPGGGGGGGGGELDCDGDIGDLPPPRDRGFGGGGLGRVPRSLVRSVSESSSWLVGGVSVPDSGMGSKRE